MRLIVCFGGTGNGFYSAKPKEMSSRLGAAGVGFRSAKPACGGKAVVYVKRALKDETLGLRNCADVRFGSISRWI